MRIEHHNVDPKIFRSQNVLPTSQTLWFYGLGTRTFKCNSPIPLLTYLLLCTL